MQNFLHQLAALLIVTALASLHHSQGTTPNSRETPVTDVLKVRQIDIVNQDGVTVLSLMGNSTGGSVAIWAADSEKRSPKPCIELGVVMPSWQSITVRDGWTNSQTEAEMSVHDYPSTPFIGIRDDGHKPGKLASMRFTSKFPNETFHAGTVDNATNATAVMQSK